MSVNIHGAVPLMARRFLLAEGPFWQPDTQTLWFVDIKTGSVFSRHDGDSEPAEHQLGQYAGAVVPAASGRLTALLTTGVYTYSPAEGLRLLCRPPELTENLRLNDAAADPAGRLWFGTLSLFPGTAGSGSLFRLDPDGRCRRMLTDVRISNGLDWSPDGQTMYYIDTPTGGVDAFDFDPGSGDIQNRRRVYTVEDGLPDGMTLDAEGMLWVALWGGGKVIRIDPLSGRRLAELPLPAQNVTSCCFAGEDCDRLIVTTSGESLPPPNGQLFTVRPGVRGRAPFVFDDSRL